MKVRAKTNLGSSTPQNYRLTRTSIGATCEEEIWSTPNAMGFTYLPSHRMIQQCCCSDEEDRHHLKCLKQINIPNQQEHVKGRFSFYKQFFL